MCSISRRSSFLSLTSLVLFFPCSSFRALSSCAHLSVSQIKNLLHHFSWNTSGRGREKKLRRLEWLKNIFSSFAITNQNPIFLIWRFPRRRTLTNKYSIEIINKLVPWRSTMFIRISLNFYLNFNNNNNNKKSKSQRNSLTIGFHFFYFKIKSMTNHQFELSNQNEWTKFD